MILDGYYGGERWCRISLALKTAPMHTVFRVNTMKCTVAEAKERLQAVLPSIFAVDDLCEDALQVRCVRQEISMRPTEEVIVDVRCAEAVMRGADVFAAGIKSMPECPTDSRVSVYADVNGRCTRGLLRTFVDEGKTFIGIGSMKMSRLDWLECPKGLAVRMTAVPERHPSMPGSLSGILLLQNAPSLLAARAVGPQPGERVLDMCASPGGKTAHLYALSRGLAHITACDKNANKAAALQATLDRLGCDGVHVVTGDACRLGGSYDAILLDPPCSGIGQRPRLGDILSDAEWSNLTSYSAYQERLFDSAHRMLKTGGRLVYSTCTLNPDENQLLIRRMLDKHADLRLERLEPRFGAQVIDEAMLSFVPGECDTIGFFIAKLVKQ